MRNMKPQAVSVHLPFAALICLAALMLSGCEQLFTSNLLSSLRRDPSTMTSEQKTAYAQQALSSGDPAVMMQAFDALTSGGTANLTTQQKVYAVELGVGATSIQSTAAQIGAQYNAGQDTTAAINSAAASIDPVLVSQTAALLASLPSGSGATASDYAMVAIALGLAAANQAGGVQNLTGTESDVVQAKTFFDTSQAMLQASGQSTSTVSGIAGLFKA
ncbi:MAG TPA: hypothetical protein VMW73_02435 [Spirochaetia bacterium]|nr:hypothetical protein [Spirochaetia bacterium]